MTDAVADLPPDASATTGPLRRRIREMDDAARPEFLAKWAVSGLPQQLANGDGNDEILDAMAHCAIERLIAEHEQPADFEAHLDVTRAVAALPAGVRFSLVGRLNAHGLANVALRPGGATVGQVAQLVTAYEQAVADADTPIVADTLGPVGDGHVVADPVPDGVAVADMPPRGKVAELLLWVGTDPSRAAVVLAAERAKANPRTSLVTKITPLASEAPPPPAAEIAGPPAETSEGPLPLVDVPGGSVAVADNGGIDPAYGEALTFTLESENFRAQPVSEWGPLKRAAYFSRLSAELEVAAGIAAQWAKA